MRCQTYVNAYFPSIQYIKALGKRVMHKRPKRGILKAVLIKNQIQRGLLMAKYSGIWIALNGGR